jgi:multidrug efflux pump subunit AcrA (membrane-fusion protein)
MAGAEYVFVVADNRAARRAVRPAPGAGDPVAIESGLAAGELVVVAGAEELADGQRVRTRPLEP